MIQTSRGNSPNIITSPLAGLHPSNLNNTYGRVISRSPGNTNHINSQENRSLSPNKLNATKKPMISNQTYLPFSNNLTIGNQSPRYISNASPSGNAKYNSNSNNIYPNQNNQNINNINNYFSNPGKNNRQPLINSNGYENRNGRQIPSYEKGKYCENHNNKLAEFISEDDGETGYCQKCAINLASKGFSVIRKNQFEHQEKSNIFDEHKIKPFHEPQLANKYGYSEISKFMTQIDSVHSSYLAQIHKYQTIESHYTHQYTITQEFYESLMNTVEQMRSDHLADLEMEAKKHTQLACIKEDHLKSDLEQLYVIRNDIMQSVSIILESFDSSDIQMAFNAYRQQISMFKSKIEEETGEFGQEIIDEKEKDLQQRLKLIEEYLLNVWTKNEQNENPAFQKVQNVKNNQINFAPQENTQKTVKNLFNLERGQGYGQQVTPSTAYRKLFDDENENECLESKQNPYANSDYQFNHIEKEVTGESLTGQTSPQFKNI